MCSQLRVGSTLNSQLGYTHLKDYINTQRKKRKAAVHGHAAVWLAKELHFEHVPERQRMLRGTGEQTRWWGDNNWRKSDAHGPPPLRERIRCSVSPPTPTTLLLQSWRISSYNKHHSNAGVHLQANLIHTRAESMLTGHSCYTGVPLSAFPCVKSKVMDIIVDFCRWPLSNCTFNIHHIGENDRFRRIIMAPGCCDIHSM